MAAAGRSPFAVHQLRIVCHVAEGRFPHPPNRIFRLCFISPFADMQGPIVPQDTQLSARNKTGAGNPL